MNYLAHLFLATLPANSGEREGGLAEDPDESLVGALLGDFVKGSDLSRYSAAIQRGIRLHRRVDSFTDAHRVVLRSKRRIDPRYRLLKGVMVDIFYDHFLAKNWGEYSGIPLEEFAQNVYASLRRHNGVLPRRLKSMLPYMVGDNWLLSYREVETVGIVLGRMSQRLSRRTILGQGAEQLRLHYGALEEDFREFFPELKAYVDKTESALSASV